MLSPFLSFFAAGSGPAVHLTQAPVFQVGPIVISNVMLYGWLSIIFLLIGLSFAARKITIHPKGGIIQIIEVVAEFIRGTVEGAFEDKSKVNKYMPYFVSLFFFILTVNWLGLLPITREAFEAHGNALFKPWTASFNSTLAMAVVTMGFVYTMTLREMGFKQFVRHFFVGNPKNPLFFFIGLIEMVSDSIRVVSLSLRLFLNVAIGEIMIAVFAYLGGVIAPVAALPFFLMEMFVLALQAYIFVILAIMYLAVAVNEASRHEAEHAADLTEDDKPEKIKAETA
ncbi:MAG TPA: F0F1 ATP synthase subunit A [Candidatus Saccharimonadales bacterium]|nr:F0F1 ATP synthase subunit A [Candidatus Saccharimonadales bacterium]